MGKKNELWNRNGFSMVELLVSIGLLGIISLSVMQASKISNDTKKSFFEKNDTNNVNRIITLKINKQATCDATFAGKSVGDQVEITSPSGNISFAAGTKMSGLVINSIEITSFEEHEVVTITENGSTKEYKKGVVETTIRYVKDNEEAKVVNEESFKTLVVLDSHEVIEKCDLANFGSINMIRENICKTLLGVDSEDMGCTDVYNTMKRSIKESLCLDLGGNWNNTAETCLPGPSNVNCPVGEYLRGVNDDNTLICSP